jgi:hypothetical protein
MAVNIAREFVAHDHGAVDMPNLGLERARHDAVLVALPEADLVTTG